ncbi:uncharacterized protein [Hyperolius riggenbachi]|uniref:uncharacterized protein n=1 Tax=Hyperolius riggenbachi TaxID=752182 RepID=UPI0035A28125
MEKFAYLVFDSYIEMQVLLTRQRGNCTYHNQRYKSYKTELEMQSAALEDLEFDEDIWRDVDSHVDAESNDEFDFRVDVHNGAYPFTFADPHKAPYFAVHDKINSKVEAWINLQSNTEAWRDLESRNRAWTDLQSNMTALAAKHKSKEAQQACWRGYQDYLFHWRCPERLRESPILEKIEEKAKRKCCFYTRKYLHNLLATGQVTLGNAEHCRY